MWLEESSWDPLSARRRSDSRRGALWWPCWQYGVEVVGGGCML